MRTVCEGNSRTPRKQQNLAHGVVIPLLLGGDKSSVIEGDGKVPAGNVLGLLEAR